MTQRSISPLITASASRIHVPDRNALHRSPSVTGPGTARGPSPEPDAHSSPGDPHSNGKQRRRRGPDRQDSTASVSSRPSGLFSQLLKMGSEVLRLSNAGESPSPTHIGLDRRASVHRDASTGLHGLAHASSQPQLQLTTLASPRNGHGPPSSNPSAGSGPMQATQAASTTIRDGRGSMESEVQDDRGMVSAAGPQGFSRGASPRQSLLPLSPDRGGGGKGFGPGSGRSSHATTSQLGKSQSHTGRAVPLPAGQVPGVGPGGRGAGGGAPKVRRVSFDPFEVGAASGTPGLASGSVTARASGVKQLRLGVEGSVHSLGAGLVSTPGHTHAHGSHMPFAGRGAFGSGMSRQSIAGAPGAGSGSGGGLALYGVAAGGGSFLKPHVDVRQHLMNTMHMNGQGQGLTARAEAHKSAGAPLSRPRCGSGPLGAMLEENVNVNGAAPSRAGPPGKIAAARGHVELMAPSPSPAIPVRGRMTAVTLRASDSVPSEVQESDVIGSPSTGARVDAPKGEHLRSGGGVGDSGERDVQSFVDSDSQLVTSGGTSGSVSGRRGGIAAAVLSLFRRMSRGRQRGAIEATSSAANSTSSARSESVHVIGLGLGRKVQAAVPRPRSASHKVGTRLSAPKRSVAPAAEKKTSISMESPRCTVVASEKVEDQCAAGEFKSRSGSGVKGSGSLPYGIDPDGRSEPRKAGPGAAETGWHFARLLCGFRMTATVAESEP